MANNKEPIAKKCRSLDISFFRLENLEIFKLSRLVCSIRKLFQDALQVVEKVGFKFRCTTLLSLSFACSQISCIEHFKVAN